MKYDSREKVLVQLSAIRCLYCSFSTTQLDLDRSANGADFKTFSQQVVRFFSRHSQSLYHLLIGYLESRDQFISFTASKALIYVMLYSGVEPHAIEDIFIKLQAHIDTHGAVYCLQTIREFLKISRKKNLKLTNRTKVSNQSTGLRIISCNGYWKSTLQLFLNTRSRESGMNQGLQQSLAEFLSLTTELLRHKCEDVSTVSITRSICHLQEYIASSLQPLLSLAENFVSVFILKRFIDVLLKVKQVCSANEVSSVAQVLTKLFRIPLAQSILCEWLERHVELTLSTRPHLAEDNISQSEIELVDISVRKTILLVFESVASLLRKSSLLLQPQEPPSNDSASTVCLYGEDLSGVLSSLWELLSSCMALDHSRTHHYTVVLYQVVSDEDSCLVHTLKASTSIFRLTTQNPAILESVPGLNTFAAVANAHSLWLCFLKRTGFDHSMLLDLILTPEIDFSSALHGYLTLVCEDWSGFEKAASDSFTQQILLGSPMERGNIGEYSTPSSELEDEEAMEDYPGFEETPAPITVKPSPSSVETLQREDEPKPITTSIMTGALVDYSSSSEEEEAAVTASPPPRPYKISPFPFKTPCVYPGDTTIAQTASILPTSEPISSPPTSLHPSSSCSPLLEQVMGCLIRLRMSLERLGKSELIPQHIASTRLISTIQTAEELYEKL